MSTAETATAQAMTAAQLYERLLHGQALAIVDVRNEQDFERWHVEGHADQTVVNIPYYDFIEDEDAAVSRVPQGCDVLVICAKEGSSQYVAGLLNERQINASYLEGGITSWGNVYDTRTVVRAAWGEILQIARPARGDLSFLIVSDGQAAIIDPLRHIQHYQAALVVEGATLKAIFETHVHADHISGGPALAAATKAAYYVHPYDAIHPIDMLPALMAYQPIHDGQVFTIGQTSVRVIWYPGHTLGQVNYLMTAPDGSRYLFSGDGIFLRSFGRPDLGGRGEAWTPILYQSMFERLPREIDANTVVLPAHFSSLDEGHDGIFAASYGELLEENTSLQPRSLEEFSRFVLSHLPVFPPEYVEIKRVNIGLVTPNEQEASELELGKNICALSGAA